MSNLIVQERLGDISRRMLQEPQLHPQLQKQTLCQLANSELTYLLTLGPFQATDAIRSLDRGRKHTKSNFEDCK